MKRGESLKGHFLEPLASEDIMYYIRVYRLLDWKSIPVTSRFIPNVTLYRNIFNTYSAPWNNVISTWCWRIANK